MFLLVLEATYHNINVFSHQQQQNNFGPLKVCEIELGLPLLGENDKNTLKIFGRGCVNKNYFAVALSFAA